jgi:SET domain-containing protein
MKISQGPLFEIRSSPISGKGAFALQPIPAFTRLIEYTGERVSHAVADARYEDEDANGYTHTVLFTVDDDTVIDAGVGGNDARFFNHSCAPNAQSRIVRKRVYLESIRDIAPGEEITYDYEIPRDGEDDETARRLWPCHCGAPTCRGTLLLPLPKARRKKPARATSRRKKQTA